MSLTSEQITAKNFKKFYEGILPYLGGSAHTGFTPIGTIIAVMGKTAPTNYLACNGQVVNIADYPELAIYFNSQFNASNFFGGDGTTTFGIPDLRGEFLRGTGTNGHANQGSGAAVGVHQNGTEFPILYSGKGTSSDKPYIGFKIRGNLDPTEYNSITNMDKAIARYSSSTYGTATATIDGTSTAPTDCCTSRPTNTSVLYCIATKNIFMDAGSNYSTEEQVVGTWIDGKPLYQKTIQIPVSAFSSTTGSSSGYYSVSVFHNILNLGITVDIYGQAYGNVVRPVPFSYGADNPDTSFFASAGINNTSVFIECGTKFRKSVIDTNTYGAYITIQYTKTTD